MLKPVMSRLRKRLRISVFQQQRLEVFFGANYIRRRTESGGEVNTLTSDFCTQAIISQGLLP
jgi:hypothetical protein